MLQVSWVPSVEIKLMRTGNTPPFKLPAKGQYLTFDRKRAATHFGVPFRSTPSFFPVNTVVVRLPSGSCILPDTARPSAA